MKNFIFSLGLMLCISLPALAADLNPTTGKTTFSLYAAGSIDQHPVYQLLLESAGQSEYQIVWKDADGTILYDEYVSGKEIIRNYMLDLGDLGNADIIIEVYKRNGRKVESFRISTKKDLNVKSR
jgi:hypothetical protein